MQNNRLDALFRLCQQDIRRFFLSRTGSPEVAADLTQETFLRMLGPDRPQDSRAYLFRISRNVLTDYYRSCARSRQTEISEQEWQELPDTAPEPEVSVLSREELAVVGRAIEELPPRAREVFEMFKFQGLSYEEIAKRLGISKNTVMVHLARAIGRCKNQLDLYHQDKRG